MRIPEDEMLLAEMIAECSARGLVSCRGSYYRDGNGSPVTSMDTFVACCAAGALQLVGRPIGFHTSKGNDLADWTHSSFDDGESLGWAFREAMRP